MRQTTIIIKVDGKEVEMKRSKFIHSIIEECESRGLIADYVRVDGIVRRLENGDGITSVMGEIVERKLFGIKQKDEK